MQNTSKIMGEMTRIMQEFTSKTEQIFKIASPNLGEIETIEPQYVNPKFKSDFHLPTVYRFNQTGMRYYFTADDDNIKFYPSVTTIIGNTTPMSFGLKKILADKGFDGFNSFMREKADYGTFLHIIISDYLSSGSSAKERWFDFDSIAGRLSVYREEKYINYSTYDWEWKAKKDMASLIQFIYDYRVEPIAIEAVGVYDDGTNHFAGALDLVCYMTIEEKGFFGEVYKSGERKGEPKESKQERKVTAIVDFKSGKSGFFDDHEIQLAMYKMMAEQSFGLKIDKVFNVAPKEWQGSTPTYSISDQTDSELVAKIPFMLGQYAVEWKEPKDIQIITGKVNGSGLTDAVQLISAKEFMLRKLGRVARKAEKQTTESMITENGSEYSTEDMFVPAAAIAKKAGLTKEEKTHAHELVESFGKNEPIVF